jgi:hypothetical protein
MLLNPALDQRVRVAFISGKAKENQALVRHIDREGRVTNVDTSREHPITVTFPGGERFVFKPQELDAI